MSPATPPTGAVRELTLDDVFFSVTDIKGVIELSNSVFETLSGYEHEELVGAPHNIIRHPDMPGGAFKLVWDELLAGKPAVAYVHNLTKDGAMYTVLSTLLPVGEKLLSVRVVPCRNDLLDVADTLYRHAKEQEVAAAAEGKGRHDAAIVGAESLNKDLAGAGFETFEHYLKDLLPAEVAARVRAGDVPPRRPGAQGPAAELLTAAQGVWASTEQLVGTLDELAELTAQLLVPARDIAPLVAEIRERVGVAVAASEARRASLPFLADVAQAMEHKVQAAEESRDAVTRNMAQAARRARDLRFRIALARLHTTMVARFAAEILDGKKVPEVRESITLLARALREGVDGVRGELSETAIDFKVVAEAVSSTTKSLSGFRRQRGKWTAELPADRDEEIARIESSLEVGEDVERLLDQLGAVGARSANLNLDVDDEKLVAQVAQIESLAGQIG